VGRLGGSRHTITGVLACALTKRTADQRRAPCPSPCFFGTMPLPRILCRCGLFIAILLQSWQEYATLGLALRAYAPDALVSVLQLSLLGTWVAASAAIDFVVLRLVPYSAREAVLDFEATRLGASWCPWVGGGQVCVLGALRVEAGWGQAVAAPWAWACQAFLALQAFFDSTLASVCSSEVLPPAHVNSRSPAACSMRSRNPPSPSSTLFRQAVLVLGHLCHGCPVCTLVSVVDPRPLVAALARHAGVEAVGPPATHGEVVKRPG
jgi:hypothetical protein